MMQEQSIRQIRDAEAQAAMLCRVANEKANEMREEARAEASAAFETAKNEAEAKYGAMLTAVRARTADLEATKKAEAEELAAKLTETARRRMPEAVSMVVWEIMEQCR